MKSINNIINFTVVLTLLTVFSAILFASCQERIDITTDDSPPRLVIYGYITTDTTRHAIRITRSTGYFYTAKPEGITDAVVSISTTDTTYILTEDPDDAGLYLTSQDVYGIIGESYTMRASLRFDGATVNCEATSILPEAPRLDSVAITPAPFLDDLLQALIWGHLPASSDNHFSFQLYRNNILLNDSLRNFNLADDKFIGTKDIVAYPAFMMYQKNERRKIDLGDTVGIQVRGITSEYYYFLNSAMSENFASIPIFSGPPANVETNIRCSAADVLVSGFFTAFSKSGLVETVYNP